MRLNQNQHNDIW